MDKKQAEATSKGVMSQAKADRSRQRGRRPPKTISPWWGVLGIGLMGCGVGIAVGLGRGSELQFAVIGFGLGIAAGMLITRSRA